MPRRIAFGSAGASSGQIVPSCAKAEDDKNTKENKKALIKAVFLGKDMFMGFWYGIDGLRIDTMVRFFYAQNRENLDLGKHLFFNWFGKDFALPK